MHEDYSEMRGVIYKYMFFAQNQHEHNIGSREIVVQYV